MINRISESAALHAAHLAGVALGHANALLAIAESEARYKATEAALRASDERYQFAMRGANDGIWDWNLLTNDVVFSSRWKSMLGYLDEELDDNVVTWARLLHPDDAPRSEERVRQFLSKEIDKYEIEFRMAHKEGGYRNILARAHLVVDEQQRPVRLVGTHVDITERIQAEVALRQSEEMLRRTQAIAHVVGWSFDIAESKFTISRDAMRQMGWEASDGELRDFNSAIHPEDLPRVRTAWLTACAGAPCEMEYRMVIDAAVTWVYTRSTTDLDRDGKPVTIIGVTQDVTARRKLEEQFQQAQKMEAIGQLAGGIAHDFNNLMTVVNGSAELLLDELPPGSMRDGLTDIRTAGERAAALTYQLLAFSRKQLLQARDLDLNETVSQLERMLARLIGEDIAVRTILDPMLARLYVDPGQIEQVILNLVVNARDAMPTGGRLTIETKNVFVSRGTHGGAQELSPGHYVELSVEDNGMGIPEALKEKIFEPFFTTKGVGKGTGLGLATVYGIVTQSGGHISVTSRLGVGTKFTLLLPSASAKVSSGAASPGATPTSRGTETILLVEDEDAVRRIVRTTLERNGYRVLEANVGSVAVELARQHAGQIDLLLTDVVMPGMSGRQVADVVCEKNPDLPVLFMSGYTDDAIVRNGVLEAKDHFLAKPFAPTALIRKVRGVLDARPLLLKGP
ncbi:MAG: Blue-light-activated protein [Labilithrix sp.]|nr:Blue-light-activated protein [Labilithrix sp.]